MKIIKWKLDTCGCTVIIDTDESPIQAQESFTGHNREVCERHAYISGVQEHYETVLSENVLKNQVSSHCLTTFPGAPFDYSFSESGELTFTFPETAQDDLSAVSEMFPTVIFQGI